MESNRRVEAVLIRDFAHECPETIRVVCSEHADNPGRGDLARAQAAEYGRSCTQLSFAREASARRVGLSCNRLAHFHSLKRDQFQYGAAIIKSTSTRQANHSKNGQH